MLASEPVVVPLDDGKKKPEKKEKIDRSQPRSFKLIPNIKDFIIELRPYDWLLLLFGIRKRFKPGLEFHTWHNGEANLYLDYMFKRLRKLVELEKYEEARETIWILMNSAAYKVAAVNHVLHNWHRKLAYKQVQFVLRDVTKLVKSRSTALKYARVYMQDKNKVRPLGVPAISWRVYLHMYNNCLVEWRQVTEQNKQHGYLPRKGVVSAWFALAKKLNQPNIYEADYKGFFNNVKHISIYKTMLSMGFPAEEAMFVWNLNLSLVKLTDEDLIHEPHRQFVYDPLNPGEVYWGNTQYTLWTSFETSIVDLYEMGCFDDDVPMEGVPQGAPTSCSVATLALRDIESRLDVIIYADDIIYFPEDGYCDPIKDLSDEERGLIINEDKSRWIKRNGIWEVDSFRFLGIRYFPYSLKRAWNFANNWPLYVISSLLDLHIGAPFVLPLLILAEWREKSSLREGVFMAETRKGANLKFTNRESFLSYLALARDIILDNKYLMDKWSSKSLLEFLTSHEVLWKAVKNKSMMLFASVDWLASSTKDLKYSFAKEKLSMSKDMTAKMRQKSISILNTWITEELSNPQPSRKKISIWQTEINNLKAGENSISLKEVEYRNPLTGYFLARMYYNSWTIKIKQSFALTYTAESWVAEQWSLYSWNNIVPLTAITTFTSSSFACHALLEYANVLTRGKPKVRRVSSSIRKVNPLLTSLRQIMDEGASYKFPSL